MPQLPVCPAEVGCPAVHQAAPTLEEITAGVGRLGGVLYRIGECGLDRFSGYARPFRGPVPEARLVLVGLWRVLDEANLLLTAAHCDLYSTSAARPMTSTMRTSLSRPSASVRRISSPVSK